MLPPESYRKAREQARFHIQFSHSSVADDIVTPCHCALRGTVLKIFRGAKYIRVGDAFSITVPVARAGDDIPCGPTIWADLDKLRECSVVEAFLSGEPPELTLQLGQFALLSAMTDTPIIVTSENQTNRFARVAHLLFGRER